MQPLVERMLYAPFDDLEASTLAFETLFKVRFMRSRQEFEPLPKAPLSKVSEAILFFKSNETSYDKKASCRILTEVLELELLENWNSCLKWNLRAS
jgi:hypothetical protein